jgi:hypothetical protein
MRDDEGDLKGFDEADLVVVAALDNPYKPVEVEVYAFEPKVLRQVFEANIAAHKAEGRGGKGPVYICLDPIEGDKPKAVGSGLAKQALWSATVPLSADDEVSDEDAAAGKPEKPSSKDVADFGKMDVEGFLQSVKAELAARLNVPAKCLSLELRLQV